MMEKFRNLSKNIFFKIFLGFLALTFVMFGISDFILNGNKNWVAKIGGETISYSKFLKVLQSERSVIYKSGYNKENKEQILKYLESNDFKNDVLGKIVTSSLVKQISRDIGIYADQKIILKQIVNSPSLKGKDGNFDRNLYKDFLGQNGLTEKEHLEEIVNEIVGNIIIQSLLQVQTSNHKLGEDLIRHRDEKRVADVATISLKNIPPIKTPNEFDLNDYFEKNKSSFILPEMRKVYYMSFSKDELPVDKKISEDEIENDYKTNLADYKRPETRDFYHLTFKDKTSAEKFYNALLQASKVENYDLGKTFIKLALDLEKKDQKSVLLYKIQREDLLKEISDQAFTIKKNQFTSILESRLGFHIFYLVDSRPESTMTLNEIRTKIVAKLTANKEENGLTDLLSKIDDYLISSNSLDKTASNFNLKTTIKSVTLNSFGFDSKQKKVPESTLLEGFIENGFSLKKQQTSKLLFSTTNQKYYALFVDEINELRQRSLDEVRPLVEDAILKERREEKLREMAQNVADQIKNDPSNFVEIVNKNGLKLEKNRVFQRFYLVDSANGQQVPYSNRFLNEIFDLKISQVTTPIKISNSEFSIAILRNINHPNSNISKTKVLSLEQEMDKEFKMDIVTSYNKYVQSKFPVKINQELLNGNKSDN